MSFVTRKACATPPGQDKTTGYWKEKASFPWAYGFRINQCQILFLEEYILDPFIDHAFPVCLYHPLDKELKD